MNKHEIIEHLHERGIHKLRTGETVQDALDYVHGKISFRKGHIEGRDKNETIQLNNKEAFMKTFIKPEYEGDGLLEMDINEIPKETLNKLYDCRDNTNEIGVLEGCHYCGTAIRCDEYDQYEILNCEDKDCRSYAIYVNCM